MLASLCLLPCACFPVLGSLCLLACACFPGLACLGLLACFNDQKTHKHPQNIPHRRKQKLNWARTPGSRVQHTTSTQRAACAGGGGGTAGRLAREAHLAGSRGTRPGRDWLRHVCAHACTRVSLQTPFCRPGTSLARLPAGSVVGLVLGLACLLHGALRRHWAGPLGRPP